VPLLKPRYRLVLLSNTNVLHFAHFRAQLAHALDQFDALVTSHEVGVRKPAEGIFRHAQGVVGCAPQQVLFIDDMPTNVAAARAFGWQGVVYEPGADLEALLLVGQPACCPPPGRTSGPLVLR
jgi:putative hydrolase of the HAD superfamily